MPFFSCTEENWPENAPDSQTDNDDVEFSLEFASRSAEDGLDDIKKYFKDEKTTLWISQRFSSGDNSLDFTPDSKNLYEYYYNGNTTADWEQGYNFSPSNPDHKLTWNEIEKNPYGNTFAFGAMFFPGGVVPEYEVPEDQTNEDVFVKTDIMGAYHKTSEKRSRLRFRLYHLMTNLKVTLVVPEWDAETNTGFFEGAVKSARVLNRTLNYTIDWGQRSTEEPPVLNAQEKTGDITMYRYFSDANVPELKKNYNLSGFGIPDLTTDNVRLYTFEAMFPPQHISSGNKLISFSIERAGIDLTYNFSTSTGTTTGDIDLGAGSRMDLFLYLPRDAKELIFLSAEITDWKGSNSEFTITEDNNRPAND